MCCCVTLVVCLISCRYASYCANVGRTYFVDPNKEMEEQYAAVNAAHAAAIAALVEGAPMSAAYTAAAQVLKVRLIIPRLVYLFAFIDRN
jgi:Xaa-Pro aminopeptidase